MRLARLFHRTGKAFVKMVKKDPELAKVLELHAVELWVRTRERLLKKGLLTVQHIKARERLSGPVTPEQALFLAAQGELRLFKSYHAEKMAELSRVRADRLSLQAEKMALIAERVQLKSVLRDLEEALRVSNRNAEDHALAMSEILFEHRRKVTSLEETRDRLEQEITSLKARLYDQMVGPLGGESGKEEIHAEDGNESSRADREHGNHFPGGKR